MISSGDEWSLTTEEAVIETWNSMLQTYLASFSSVNEGVSSAIVDTTVPFSMALDSPTTYGSPDATCYNEDGVSCLWFNDYHPGVVINELVASDVQDAIDAL